MGCVIDPRMNILSLVIDRLHVGYLGCYGNSWIATPNFDRLASDGFVFDQALIQSADLAEQYAAMTLQSRLVGRLQDAGITTALITDDPAVADMPWAAEIEDVVRVDLQRGSIPADEISKPIWPGSSPSPGNGWKHRASRFACGCIVAAWATSGTRRSKCASDTSTKTSRLRRQRPRSLPPLARRLRPRRIARRDASLCRSDIAIGCLPGRAVRGFRAAVARQSDHAFGPICARLSPGRASPAGADR